jgi:hypothetical protein
VSTIVVVVIVAAIGSALPPSRMPGVSVPIPIPMAGLPPPVGTLRFPASLSTDVSSVLPFVGGGDPDKPRPRLRGRLDDDRWRRGRCRDDNRRWRDRSSVDPFTRDPDVLVPLPLPAPCMQTPSGALFFKVAALPEIRPVSQAIVSRHPDEALSPLEVFGWRRWGCWRSSPPASGRRSCSPTSSRWRRTSPLSSRRRGANLSEDTEERDRVREVQEHRRTLSPATSRVGRSSWRQCIDRIEVN